MQGLLKTAKGLLIATLVYCGPAFANGSLNGFVVSQDTLSPIANATVEIESGCILISCAVRLETTSAADGGFAFAGLPARTYTLNVSFGYDRPDNYLPAQKSIAIADGDALSTTVLMVSGAQIRGVVRSTATAEAIGGMDVYLTEAAVGHDTIAIVKTDSTGTFNFVRVETGNYLVHTGNYGAAPYQDQYWSNHPLTPPSVVQAANAFHVDTGQVLDGIDFTLPAGGVIRGVLTDSYSKLPIANAHFNFPIYDPAGSQPYQWTAFGATTGADGHYEIHGLPDTALILGAYAYTPYYNLAVVGCPANCSNPLTGTVLQSVTGTILDDVNIALFPGAVIKGRASRSSDGASIVGATVRAFSSALGGSIVSSTTTDAFGNYVLTGMVQNVAVEVSDAELGGSRFIAQDYEQHDCQSGKCAPLSGEIVAAPPYSVTAGINFSLHAGRSIRGHIKSSINGQGMPGYLYLFYQDGSLRTVFATDADGGYSSDGLQAGTYYIEARVLTPSGYDCQAYSGLACGDGAVVVPGMTALKLNSYDIYGVDFGFDDRLFSAGFETP